MPYEYETNSYKNLADIVSPQGRTSSTFLDDLIKSAGIDLAKTALYGESGTGYTGGAGFERAGFNQEQTLSSEQSAANDKALEGIKFLGRNVRGEGDKPAYLTEIIGKNGDVLISSQQNYKKIGFVGQVLPLAVNTFLSAAFAGAAGFGPLSSGPSSFGSSAFGKSLGTVGRGAVQGGAQSSISAAIQGRDPIKAGITGALSGGLSSSLTPIFGTSALGRAATSGITSGVTAAVTGGDPLNAALLSIVGQSGNIAGLDGSAANFVNNLARITTQVQLNNRKQKCG